MNRVIGVLGAALLAFVLTEGYASAQACDFLTGGGFIVTTASGTHPPAKANLSIAGGCKKNAEPYWGHLEYQDRGNGLNAHGRTITAYIQYTPAAGEHQPTGARIICGTATTSPYGDVYFKVFVEEKGEPGDDDRFWIRLRSQQTGTVVYTTEGDSLAGNDTLGGTGRGGGNIQLHAPNSRNVGTFGGECPAG